MDVLSPTHIEIYKSIIEYNPDAIIILSTNGVVMEVNQAVNELFGYSKENIQGSTYQKFIISNDEEKVKEQIKQVIKVGTPTEFYTRVYHRNGNIILLHLKIIPLFANKEIVGVCCVMKDVTELSQTKDALKNIEGRLLSLYNSTADAINILDLNGNVLDINPAFEELYGWKREEGIGKPLPIIPQPYKYQYNRIMEQARSGQDIKEIEVTCHKKDGTLIEVNLTFSPIKDETGNIIESSGISRDITKQKQLNRDLKESEERYRLITEGMTDLIGALDKAGRVNYASPSHKKVLGLAPGVYEGNFAFDMVHPDDLSLLRQQFDHMVVTKEAIKYEYRLKHVNGNWVWNEAKGNPMFDESGNILYFLVVAREVTERKQADVELRESEERYRLLANNFFRFNPIS